MAPLSLDLDAIDTRLARIDQDSVQSKSQRRTASLRKELCTFLASLPCPSDLRTVKVVDLRRFLVFKDSMGKTKIHDVSCHALGQKRGHVACSCPVRMAVSSIRNIVSVLRSIFHSEGRQGDFDEISGLGNPIDAPLIRQYIKFISKEQSVCQAVPSQATPLFLDKLRRIVQYIDRELPCPCVSLVSRFVLLRDQSFFKIQFFAGSRAGDMCQVLCQGIKRLPGSQGLLVRLCSGKTFSSDKAHSVVLPYCQDVDLCPVTGLERYLDGAKAMAVDISLGYVLRKVGEHGEVLVDHVTYSVVYDRLIHYLTTLGLYAGETPHGLRGGCAVSLAASGVASSVSDLMAHMGWRTQATPDHYARTQVQFDADLAGRLALAVQDGSVSSAERTYKGTDFDSLPSAF